LAQLSNLADWIKERGSWEMKFAEIQFAKMKFADMGF
jgi:hypothetical protein